MMMSMKPLTESPERTMGTSLDIDNSHTNGLRKPDVVGFKKTSESEQIVPWKKAFLDFMENTTLHGVRIIFMENVFVLRRFIWFVLVLGSAVLLSVQIVERIMFFYSYPMNVNVQINYNKTLVFPALTICNQNAFRATAATERGVYNLIECMYDTQCNVDRTTLARFGALGFTLEDIFKASAHRKDDLIAGCEWQGDKCGPENFTEILTDHGVCYSFNLDHVKPLMVTATGSDYGLKLTLNVEQYEYMPGPHSAAGIKILLHDQKEAPKVGELGLAVPTGSHTFVGIQLLRIQNLPKPHGACRSKDSPYYKYYTPDACQTACTTELLLELCNCRHFYMPHINGLPPVCTLQQYFECYVHKIAYVKKTVRDTCGCPVPCDFLLYDPTISFATTSVYATDSLLATSSTGLLEKKYHKALDITSRMDRLKIGAFKILEEDMGAKFELIDNALHKVLDKMLVQKSALDNIHAEIKSIYEYKKYLLTWQEFHVRKNFMRPRNAMEERTLFPLALGFQELSYHIYNKVLKIANKSYSDDVRTSVFLSLKDDLEGKADLADRAFQNYSQLYEAYANGIPIFRYKFQSETLEDSLYITPRPLLNSSLTYNSLARRLCSRVGDDIMYFKSSILNNLQATIDAYSTGVVDEVQLHELNVMFLWRGRRFYHSKSVFYQECIEYPQKMLLDRLEELERKWLVFSSNFKYMYDMVKQLVNDLYTMHDSTLKTLGRPVEMSHNFTENGTISKMEIAKEMLSDQMLESIGNLKTVVSEIRARGQNVFDSWSSVMNSANQMWKAVLEDENLEEFYTYQNQSEYLRSYDNVSTEVIKNYTEIRDSSDFRYLLGSRDSLFLISLEAMIDHLKTYYDRSQLDEKFIKDNFLQLDIFYREKSYEQITQQKAYDMFALLCDIGGSMGLFVGASALTICEILDFGLHHGLYRLFHHVRN